ncbi:unnamed protein product [Peniophora sp. CBMAI 1063]|nr:unnamed protein product [Peniophora sp. CBMAI 1063]
MSQSELKLVKLTPCKGTAGDTVNVYIYIPPVTQPVQLQIQFNNIPAQCTAHLIANDLWLFACFAPDLGPAYLGPTWVEVSLVVLPNTRTTLETFQYLPYTSSFAYGSSPQDHRHVALSPAPAQPSSPEDPVRLEKTPLRSANQATASLSVVHTPRPVVEVVYSPRPAVEVVHSPQRATSVVHSPQTATDVVHSPRTATDVVHSPRSSAEGSPTYVLRRLDQKEERDSCIAVSVDPHIDNLDEWVTDEGQSFCRGLVRFTRVLTEDGLRISAYLISQDDYNKDPYNGVTVSCIRCAAIDRGFYTSHDFIRLLEYFVNKEFDMQEKNQIRRNIECAKPTSVAKKTPLCQSIMDLPLPTPRSINKTLKIFAWPTLSMTITRALSKYTLSGASP